MSASYEQFLDRYLEAAAQGDVKSVSHALQGAMDVNAKNAGGWTALMFAARNGHTELVKLLLEKGSDVDIINPSGQTASDIAKFWNHEEIVELINPPESSTTVFKSHKQIVNFFGHEMLNRAAHRRKDSQWLGEKRTDPKSKFIIFCDLQPVVVPLPDFQTKERDQKFRLFTASYSAIETHLKDDPLLVLLGVEIPALQENVENSNPSTSEGPAWFAVDGTSLQDIDKLHAQAETLPIYPGFMQLQEKEAGIAAQARSVLAWHDRYQFCPTCGNKTEVEEAGYKRNCTNKECRSLKGVHNTCYPRVDPTVIMAVVSEDRKSLLLGRGSRFPKGMWSCLAGFIEPGETIEEACRREVQEEAGVKVGRVEYHSCQPWPMPSSLMIGCLAFATDEKITVDKDELEEARWFSRSEVVLMLTKKHEQRWFVPPEQAIAHSLIRAWVSLTSNL